MYMQPELSIIIPVYNVEEYLDKCIESIFNQSFKNFEIILVNDGSTDRSEDICNKYSKVDSRIKLISQKNLGVSVARNVALDIARGEYIGFVDLDDYIHYDMYNIMIETAIKTSSDMVICDYINIFENYEGKDIKINKVSIYNFTPHEILNKLFVKGKFDVVPWNKLYKKSLFCNLRFKVNRVNKDEFLIHEIIYKCKKISIIDSKLYYYRHRPGSIMNSKFEIRKFDRLYALSKRVEFFYENNEIELMMKAEKWLVDSLIWNYYFAIEENYNIEGELKEIKKEFNKRFLGLMRNNILSIKQKLLIIIFYYSPKVYKKLILNKEL